MNMHHLYLSNRINTLTYKKEKKKSVTQELLKLSEFLSNSNYRALVRVVVY